MPYVPNVMVEDPTLHEDGAAAKAREAAEESRRNEAAAGGSTAAEHHQPHRQRGEASLCQPSRSMGRPADRYTTSTAHRQADAPPAYSPPASSPTPSSSYQTFAPPTAAAQSGAMAGPPSGSEETLWRRIESNTATRKRVRTVLGALLIISIVAALFGGSVSIGN